MYFREVPLEFFTDSTEYIDLFLCHCHQNLRESYMASFFLGPKENRLETALGVSPTPLSTMNLPKVIQISKKYPGWF